MVSFFFFNQRFIGLLSKAAKLELESSKKGYRKHKADTRSIFAARSSPLRRSRYLALSLSLARFLSVLASTSQTNAAHKMRQQQQV